LYLWPEWLQQQQQQLTPPLLVQRLLQQLASLHCDCSFQRRCLPPQVDERGSAPSPTAAVAAAATATACFMSSSSSLLNEQS
jgi:hypothetical protein